jgi:hypothetical protein
MRWIFAIVVAVLSNVGNVSADSPLRPPEIHRIASPNGKFVAIADPSSGTRIVEAESGRELWKIARWCRWCYLSNDGEHLAVANDAGLVPLDVTEAWESLTFWDHGRKIRSVYLRDIVPNQSMLQRMQSHYMWGYINNIDENNRLVATRVDGRVIRFNMASGEAE